MYVQYIKAGEVDSAPYMHGFFSLCIHRFEACSAAGGGGANEIYDRFICMIHVIDLINTRGL